MRNQSQRLWSCWAYYVAVCLAVFVGVGESAQPRLYTPPADLPRYDLDIKLDVTGHYVYVRQQVVWTNRHRRPAKKLVLNNHTRFTIEGGDVGLLAKTLEVLRIAPSEVMDFEGPPCHVQKIVVIDPRANTKTPVEFYYGPKHKTTLTVPLVGPVEQGESVTFELTFKLRLPQKQGRWGQWRGVTFLAQWLPMVAYYDEKGWRPTPFVPWHQPFCNEAGIFRAHITLPQEEKIACTGPIVEELHLPGGWKRLKVGPVTARDFSLTCSRFYQEARGKVGNIRLRSLYLPGQEHYGQRMVQIAAEAIPVYESWFGPFPYPEFTVATSFFGWNGNECGGLVLIDERVYHMPHMANGFVDHLLSHEILHQWFYNAVGTDGYAETWMDEGVVTYFSHKYMNRKVGRNNKMLNYPLGLEWLPNIGREDYRHYGLFAAIARGDSTATVQPMEKFGHLMNLSAMAYDRGGKIVGMIEDRLGEAAMLDFMRGLYRKYYFRVLHVRDFQKELEDYTHRSWQEFFDNWLFGDGMTDWAINDVQIEPYDPRMEELHKVQAHRTSSNRFLRRFHHLDHRGPYKVVVLVAQRGNYPEPTTVGFAFDDTDEYVMRIPILPNTPALVLEDFNAKVVVLAKNLIRVEVILDKKPTQITVDPDQVLVDRDPVNNHWKTKYRVRFTPLYFMLDETDITNAYDKVNVIAGPWVYGSTFNNPWFTRSPLLGVRAGVYRTQKYRGGGYLAYRTNDRNLVAGIDGIFDHQPIPNVQFGFQAEQNIVTLDDSHIDCSRGAIFGRYILTPGSSLYLPPYKYVEVYANVQDRCLPTPRTFTPDADPFTTQTSFGIHYHQYYLTPYWDPEGGVAVDLTYAAGVPVFGQDKDFHQVFGQVSWVKGMPDPFGVLKDSPYLQWLAKSRFAFRVNGAVALPDEGQFFSLGGGDLFRGFDLRERQGSVTWVASLEWRIPVVTGLQADYFDHVAGLRGIYFVPFYDVGNAYLNGREVGSTAHAVGGSFRFDVAWFGLIERTMLRLDVAKTLNESSPFQFWVGIQHPF
ncbi:MAG: M1 family aminopeptidase [Gemmataceae bacterium]